MNQPLPQATTPHTAATRALGLLIGLLTFGFYAWRCSPSPYLLDSAELAAASFGLGVAHPPGEPLALLWGRALCMLPLGSVAFRVAVGQALCGAGATVTLYVLGYAACDSLIPILRPSRGLRACLCAVGAVVFALSPGAADVSSRPEVYALATLLALVALWCAQTAMVKDDARWAVAAAFTLGLGLANHPLIAGTAGLGAVAASVPLLLRARWPDNRIRMLVSALSGLFTGAFVVLYVPARAYALLGHPDPNSIVWGDARSMAGWWWLLSARTFAQKASLVHGSADSSSLPFLFVEELGIPALCLAAVGLYALLRFNRVGRVRALTLFMCGAGAALAGLVGGLDPHNPDVRGYLACAFAVTAVFASLGACVLATRVRAKGVRTALGWALTFALLATPLWALASQPMMRDGARNVRSAERSITNALDATSPRAIVATGHFETAFLLGYQRLVQAQRPDITWVHTGWARSPGYANRMVVVAPALKPLLQAHNSGTGLTTASIDTLTIPFAVESTVPLAADLARALSYSAGLWRWPPQTPEADPTGLDPAMLAEADQDRQARGFLGWRVFQDARLACLTKNPIVPHLIETLQRLMPGDKVVAQLPQWCEAQGQ